ncbi:glutamate-rich protein 3-like isoform X1 [Huso huso]|uniref:Glutamate-rich protein 3-like isoform X1 n=1 Tax=Huso huso TaxID=61971 RepID=A0ABR0Y8D0_HUSHU
MPSGDSSLIPSYNGLRDDNLAHFFHRRRIRRHLRKAGLVTHSGEIVSEKVYRLNIAKQEHMDQTRQLLVTAINEKYHNTERSSHRIRDTAERRLDQDQPQRGGTTGYRAQHSTPSPGRRKKDAVHSRAERIKRYLSGLDKKTIENLTGLSLGSGVAPCGLLVIDLSPRPPDTPAEMCAPIRQKGRAPKKGSQPRSKESTNHEYFLQGSLKGETGSGAESPVVTLIYLGKQVSLPCERQDPRDEVAVYQQHCGGENLCVFKGKLLEQERFRFRSHRSPGFGFSLRFSLDGVVVQRLSTCCESRHRHGRWLGGRTGHFGVVSVHGASPCPRCQMAMKLEKKPEPQPPKTTEDRMAPRTTL